MKYVEGSRKVFLDTGFRFPKKVSWSVALIKQAAARANASFGKLDKKMADAIVEASEEVLEGRHDSKIKVDVFQTGSGTGLNMNINELIAERASQLLGKEVHPTDHVNMGQSSNDVGPSAVRIAAVVLSEERLAPALITISKRLLGLSRRTALVYKAGRTHMRDALPVTMGQEFAAFADAFEKDLALLREVVAHAKELPIGGTAVGTGMNTHPRFGAVVVQEINSTTKLDFIVARNKFRAMRVLSDLVAVSSVLSVIALDMYRLCQDLRLMFSGPLTGLGEIDIPSQEEVAGSSIMPGKTNPVTVESCMLASAQVMGLDRANQVTGMLGEFELSMGVPLMGYNIPTQIELLTEALQKLALVVIDHVVPDVERNKKYAESSPSLIAAISPRIGYDKAAAAGKRVGRSLSIREALKELGFGEAEINRMLDLKKLVNPGK